MKVWAGDSRKSALQRTMKPNEFNEEKERNIARTRSGRKNDGPKNC